MWTLYGTEGRGIAIQSSYQALKSSIVEKELVDPVYLTNVRYIDFASDAFRGPRVESDGFSTFMYKRKSFEHEKELRIITTNGLYAASIAEDSSIRIVPGVRLSVDLAQLIQRVLISPLASGLFASAVEVVARTLGFSELSVERSDLENGPIY